MAKTVIYNYLCSQEYQKLDSHITEEALESLKLKEHPPPPSTVIHLCQEKEKLIHKQENKQIKKKEKPRSWGVG